MAKTVTTASSEIVENPGWLHSDPDGAAPFPPTVTRVQNLPFAELEWRDFERLCRRLALRRGTVEHALAYGMPGQAQYGIDILVRFADGAYEVWQTKRYKAMQPAELKAAVSLFLSHRWKDKARKFVLAVACNLDATGIVDAIQDARDRLANMSIGFEPLDGTELSRFLVEEPELVDDYFGRAWVEALCPPEARDVLAKRLSRFDITSLRCRLKVWYTAWVASVDPGLPVADLSRSGHVVPAIPIRDRYVRPDVLERVIEYEAPSAPQSTGNPNSGGDKSSDQSATARTNASPQLQSTRPASASARERRVDLDKFLLGARRTIITADAGMGKSTLLRIIAINVLSEEPEFRFVREHCAGYVPVWIPFALWTRMASGQPAPPPLADVVAAFFRAQSEPALAEHVTKVLDTGKALLLVDGLDEVSDTTAARTVLTGLATFVEAHPSFIISTSRPHGLRAIGGVATSWTRVDLAPLSDAQRHTLARLWFHAIGKLETDGHTDVSWLHTQAERRATALTEALKRTPAIARLSQTPLFLLALMQLHRHRQQLPRSRFAAIAKIVEQLVEHQPRRRETEALLTVTSPLRSNLRDRLLEDFAFALHAGELSGHVTEAASEENALKRATAFAMKRQGSQDTDKAEETARSVLVFGEERAGLLVKKASETIGFLHLSIQEFLSARYLAQRPFSDRLKFVREHAEKLRWREPILYLIFLETNEGQVGQLLRAIEQAAITTPQGQHLRDALLTDAVFSDFAHDPTVAHEIAGRLFDEAELTAWGARQQHILTSGVDGLGSETVASLCATRIQCWVPNRHGYQRSSAIYAMQRWPASSHEACTRALLRLLAADEEPTRRAAAEILPQIVSPGFNTKEELKSLLKAAPSVDVVASTLYALGCGWAGDRDVAALAADARSSSDPAVQRQALRIRAMRKETDEQDFHRFLKLNYSERPLTGHMANRGLIEHFAETRRDEFITWLADEIELKYDRNLHDLVRLVGSLILCDPQHPLVAPGMNDLLAHNWIMREIFAKQGFPADRIPWTPELDVRIENFATEKDGRFLDYELHWIARVRPLPTVKTQILKSSRFRGFFAVLEC